MRDPAGRRKPACKLVSQGRCLRKKRPTQGQIGEQRDREVARLRVGSPPRIDDDQKSASGVNRQGHVFAHGIPPLDLVKTYSRKDQTQCEMVHTSVEILTRAPSIRRVQRAGARSNKAWAPSVKECRLLPRRPHHAQSKYSGNPWAEYREGARPLDADAARQHGGVRT